MNNTIKERGAASIKVDLTDGVITVRHGDVTNAILAQWTANTGDWEKLWHSINMLKAQSGTTPFTEIIEQHKDNEFKQGL